jgi:hypothetical protein
MEKEKSPIRILLVLAGVINVLFSAFHISFYYLFKWKETLSCLSNSNLSIFKTFYLGSILMVLMMAFLSIRFPEDLYRSLFGRSLSFVFFLFYLIRIFAEFVFFGFRGLHSIIIILFCAIPAAIYIWAVLTGNSKGIIAKTIA